MSAAASRRLPPPSSRCSFLSSLPYPSRGNVDSARLLPPMVLSYNGRFTAVRMCSPSEREGVGYLGRASWWMKARQASKQGGVRSGLLPGRVERWAGGRAELVYGRSGVDDCHLREMIWASEHFQTRGIGVLPVRRVVGEVRART